MATKAKNIKINADTVKKLLDTKLKLKSRVQKGENVKDAAKDLGIKVVQPL